MYIGTNYNSLNPALFGGTTAISNSFNATNAANSYLSSLFNTANKGLTGGNFTNAAGLGYVQTLKEGSSGLNAALKALSSGSAFKQNAAVSSNTAALTVQGGNSSLSFNAIPTTTVKIDQIATGQANTGMALNATAGSAAQGFQQFNIETNGRTFNFSINVAAGDTNKNVQQKMAAAINQQNMGITATVSTNTTDNTSTLSLTANNTGINTKSSFTIRDVYGSAVAATGTANMTQQAQNAIFSINGGPSQTSQSNNINLGNGVTATLKQATEQAVTVSQGKNTALARTQIDNLVSNYNKLYEATLNNSSDTKANRLFSQLVNTSKMYASSLSSVGIEFDSKGYMTVNEDTFKQASDSGKVEQFFTANRNSNFGYTNQLSRLAQQVQTNTASFVSKDTLQSSLQYTLQSSLMDNLNSFNLMNNSFYNNLRNFYQQSPNNFNSGLLFDFLL